MCKVGPFRLTSAPWPEPRRETTMMRGAVPAAGPFARHSLTSSLTRPGGPSLTHALPRYTRGPLSSPQPTPLHPSRHRLTRSLVGPIPSGLLMSSLPARYGRREPSRHVRRGEEHGPSPEIVGGTGPRERHATRSSAPYVASSLMAYLSLRVSLS